MYAYVVQLRMLIEEVRLEAFPHLHFSMEAKIAGKWMDMKLLRPNKGETLQVLDDKNAPIDPSLLKGANNTLCLHMCLVRLQGML